MDVKLIQQTQALLDNLWLLMRRMDPDDPMSEEDPYNDYHFEQVERLIGKAQDRLERRERADR
jgi:hypothetical protein